MARSGLWHHLCTRRSLVFALCLCALCGARIDAETGDL